MDKRAIKDYIIKNALVGLLSIPKTIYFNFKVLPFDKAIHFPIVISYHIKLRGVNRKNFIVQGNNKFASIRIGFGGSRFSIRNKKTGMISISKGRIVLGERTGLSEGVILDAKNASIILGRHFRCNYGTTISAENDSIVIGDEVVFGWNVTVRNYDGHYVLRGNEREKNHAPVNVGNHVWICANTHVLKGSKIKDDSVVAYGSIVTKCFDEKRVLLAGIPAKIIKKNICWEE